MLVHVWVHHSPRRDVIRYRSAFPGYDDADICPSVLPPGGVVDAGAATTTALRGQPALQPAFGLFRSPDAVLRLIVVNRS